MQNQRRHQKYRSQKAVAAWEMVVKRLCKLPAKGKRTLVTQQLLPDIWLRVVPGAERTAAADCE